ncbi:MAG TPA: DUF933 domain-containing protein [Kofleriaceae bacterium]|nr:DUF933 domain-containing protein [Kofleriaceae bacterium]
MKIGLVGFPQTGKTTVFNALTGLDAAAGYGGKSDRPNIGVVKVPDPRVDALAKLYSPKKTTYAEITFTDRAGGGAGPAGALDRGALNFMREQDALCQVVRAFVNDAGEAPDPVREIRDLEAETILADLELVERRIERLAKDRSNPRELALLGNLAEALGDEVPLRRADLAPDDEKALAGFRFLSIKPLLVVVNTGEDEAAAPVPDAIAAAARERGLGAVAMSAAIEMDIAQMPEAEQGEFLASLGLEEPAKNRFIRAAFSLLDLVSMLTAGPDECRAWPIARGIRAPVAAGKIHSDIERGFIRAEVIRVEDLLRLGSEAKCRDAGVLRVEGKDYIVSDGDVVHFRFNV